MPAIKAYAMACGTATAATVRPATRSRRSQVRLYDPNQRFHQPGFSIEFPCNLFRKTYRRIRPEVRGICGGETKSDLGEDGQNGPAQSTPTKDPDPANRGLSRHRRRPFGCGRLFGGTHNPSYFPY